MTIEQPKTIIDYMWNGWKSMKPIGTIIHNDYGRMDAYGYQDWLRRTRVPNPALGFAHDYIDRNTIGHFVRTNRAAYHAGDGRGTGNSQYIGIEVNQSRGPEFGDITQEQFIENENMALRQSAEYHHKYGWTPNRTTVRLHNQFSSTSCPHLSQAIHGYGTKVQDYFIAKVKKYMSLGKTVQSMIEAENNGKSGDVKEERPVTPSGRKSNFEIAQEVLEGKWGNNPERKQRLQKAGYNYNNIQNRVNDILSGGGHSEPKQTKSVDTLAREVINGQWGVGDQRRVNLERAGHNYNSIQNRVNQILGSPVKPQANNINRLAQEVINGMYGSGDARKKALGAQYNAVQKRVNEMLKGVPKAAQKSIKQLADEVERGLHGNGEQRKKSLGSRYNEVQAEINRRYSK